MHRTPKQTVQLDGSNLSFADVKTISQGACITISPSVRPAIEASRKAVQAMVEAGKPVYGINTGFGYSARTSIPREQLAELQQNILLSHAAGYGTPLTIPETRLAMAMRLNVLLKGLTGVRYSLCEALADLINHEIYPIIPECGSVGASGDLAPLAHLALPLTGCGKVRFQNRVMPAAEALTLAGLKPVVLVEKEGLGLINGTQIMLSVGSLALLEGLRLVNCADHVTALSYEGLAAHLAPLNERLHAARGQLGQQIAAATIREHLAGSYLHTVTQHMKVQDPYSFRCAPQIHGASRDALAYAEQVVQRELNAATDNPLIFSDGLAISGGNFHGQPLAMAFDIAAIALSELANVSERRLNLLLDPHHSGLTAFLACHEGAESGYMAAQYLSASLVNECKLLANPACTDSIPGNIDIEDHVSMGMTSAKKLRTLTQKLLVVLAVEAMAAAQAVDLRKASPLGRGSQSLYEAIRLRVPPLDHDRIVSDDIEGAVSALQNL